MRGTREWVAGEGSVESHKSEAVDLTLGQQQAVKWVACRRLRKYLGKGVALVDLDDLRAQFLQQAWERVEGKCQAQLAEPVLDGDFP